MTIFHILLMLYAGLTLLATVIGFSVCIVAGRVETLRKRQARFVNFEKPRTEARSGQGKAWITDMR